MLTRIARAFNSNLRAYVRLCGFVIFHEKIFLPAKAGVVVKAYPPIFSKAQSKV